MLKRTYGRDGLMEALRGELEAAFSAGNLEEAIRLSRRMDQIQLIKLKTTT